MSFFDNFPTPKLLTLDPVGLSISDRSIRFVDLDKRSGGYVLENYGYKEIPKGVVVDGEVQDAEVLIGLLREVQEENDLNFVNATLPDEKGYLFRTSIPNVEQSEIAEAVEFKISENVPLDVSKAVFDYVEINCGQCVGKDHKDVVVTVVPQKTVDIYKDVIKKAGMSPAIFQLESQAVAASVVHENDERVYLIVNVEDEKTALYIVSDGVVQFSSIFSARDRVNIVSDKEAQVAPDQLSRVSNARIQEIKRLYHYWSDRDHRDSKVTRSVYQIILCGENGHEEAFLDHLSEALDTEVKHADVWVNTFSFDDYIPDITKSQSYTYPAAIGLSIT